MSHYFSELGEGLTVPYSEGSGGSSTELRVCAAGSVGHYGPDSHYSLRRTLTENLLLQQDCNAAQRDDGLLSSIASPDLQHEYEETS